MKMKDSGAGRYRPMKCSIFEQKHDWGCHGACSHSQHVNESPRISVTDRDSVRTVDTRMCVTTKGTRGSGDPEVVGRGANRNQGTLELGSLRGPAS